MSNNTYTKEAIEALRVKLSKLTLVDDKGHEHVPTHDEVDKMLALCQKRNRPSYYKLRHASGLGEEYTFWGVDMYSDDGKKMRRFESGLEKN